MSENDNDSLTDKEKLQEAQDTIHELQHELEKLQIIEKGSSSSSNNNKDTTVASLQQELKTAHQEHASQVHALEEKILSLKAQHNETVQLLQENHRLQVEQHQEALGQLGDLLKFRQQEQLETLQDFAAKMKEVGDIHQEAIELMEAKHEHDLLKLRQELEGNPNGTTSATTSSSNDGGEAGE